MEARIRRPDQWTISCEYCDTTNLNEALQGVENINNLFIIDFMDEKFPSIASRVHDLYISDSLFGPSRLKSIPAFPVNLTTLKLYNPEYKIKEFPRSLRRLTIEKSNEQFISSLPPLPMNLASLHIRSSNLTSFPSLTDASGRMLEQLTYLDLEDNKITEFPLLLPKSLNTLVLNKNKIETIPVLDIAPTLLLESNPLKQEFREIYYRYRNRPIEMKEMLQYEWLRIFRKRGKNISTLQQLIGSRKNNSLTRYTPTGRTIAPESASGAGAGATTNTGVTSTPATYTNYTNIGRRIGSFLSGYTGPSVNDQAAILKLQYGNVLKSFKGGKRKTQRKRRARKTRKN